MSSVDDERDPDDAGDPLSPWDDGELDHNGATDDGEVDRTRSGGGERTTGVGGINVVIVGDGETNATIGDVMQDHDGACNDGEVDHIVSER
jgi:hypothetical protein